VNKTKGSSFSEEKEAKRLLQALRGQYKSTQARQNTSSQTTIVIRPIQALPCAQPIPQPRPK
jgi:hypothetical protein